MFDIARGIKHAFVFLTGTLQLRLSRIQFHSLYIIFLTYTPTVTSSKFERIIMEVSFIIDLYKTESDRTRNFNLFL